VPIDQRIHCESVAAQIQDRRAPATPGKSQSGDHLEADFAIESRSARAIAKQSPPRGTPQLRDHTGLVTSSGFRFTDRCRLGTLDCLARPVLSRTQDFSNFMLEEGNGLKHETSSDANFKSQADLVILSPP